MEVPWLKLCLPNAGVPITSLVGELRSHMSSSQRTKTENRKNIATSSIRALKDGSQLKKKNLKGKKEKTQPEAPEGLAWQSSGFPLQGT